MQKVTGLGGVFFRAAEPERLNRWYAEHLGIGDPGNPAPWEQEAGPTVFSAFERETDYFGRADQQVMLNFRVPDRDAMLAQLRAAGVTVDDRVEDHPYGRFGWATDPEGNRFEIWEPLDDSPRLEAGSSN